MSKNLVRTTQLLGGPKDGQIVPHPTQDQILRGEKFNIENLGQNTFAVYAWREGLYRWDKTFIADTRQEFLYIMNRDYPIPGGWDI